MKLIIITIAALLIASASATYEYKGAKVGEFVPPPAPKKESAHLAKHGIKQNERIPAPKNSVSFLELSAEPAPAAAGAGKAARPPSAAGMAHTRPTGSQIPSAGRSLW